MNISASEALPQGPAGLESPVTVSGQSRPATYTILAQSRDEWMVARNSPSISMWPYLLNSAQTQRLSEISIYTDRGTSRDQLRHLYMNSGALKVWREMGMPISVIGESQEPPRTAIFSFGMPFAA